ncbi:MAG: GGDEF domain-containing protein [Planctomycetes bacterium]|nr:GGDEF domain-containing protein [Planctomycetota bacterium]
MSATAPRRRRRRVLTLGPIPPIESNDTVEAEQVDSLFDALGLIATCPARRPIEAILVAPESPMALHEVVRNAEAVKRVDPTVQIMLVSDQGATSAIASQVDRCLPSPLNAELLERALDGDPAINDVLPQEPAASSPMESESQSQEIGDTDLLEAILQETDQVVPLAIRAIEQRTGGGTIEYTQGGAGGPDAAPVRRGLVTWGSLRGRPVDVLAPWASWLARWIALDEMVSGLRHDARRDHLTGAWNRSSFEQYATQSIEEARHLRQELTVFVFDIDGFKQFNDRFGHDAGDTILKSLVQLLGSVIRDGDRVGRLGGDEFAVLFSDFSGPRTPGSRHPDTVEVLAHRFQKQISDLRFPELGLAAPGRLSISGGLASFPWDGDTVQSLIRIADQRALASKRRGKNCLTFGPES